MSCYKIAFISLILFISQSLYALGASELLPPDKAFKVSVTADKNQLKLVWDIEKNYYLYQDKYRFKSKTTGVELGLIDMPDGKIKQDEFFGEMKIHRGDVMMTLPYKNPDKKPELELAIRYQGCADMGVCYPPEKKLLTVKLPVANSNQKKPAIKQLLNSFSGLKLNLFEDELLPADQAFQFNATVRDGHTLKLNWLIAEGYYLYREKVKLQLLDHDHVEIAHFELPKGEPYHDESFGAVNIFYNELNLDLKLLRKQKAATSITLVAGYQGCAERGVCYPPMESRISLDLPVLDSLNTDLNNLAFIQQPVSEQDQIFQSLKSDSFLITLFSFFGFGLLLAFTPCIFPMIPILSGIIVGQGDSVTHKKAFLLSLSYVFASALTYTFFGILAALFGSNLQADFQQPWIIFLFSAIFILLSFSMFGFYNLELPKFLQAKLHDSSNKHRDGSYLGAGIMGALSSLIVGPCVAAPLAGALIYIGQTGDVVLGGSALFAMGFAMGVPLLVLGASAGTLLPKAGNWLNSTKAIFGVLMLAVAVWMLDRVVPAYLTMLFSSALLIVPAIYMHALDPLPEKASNWMRFWKGLSVMMLVFGILILIGLSSGGGNPLQPLKNLNVQSNGASSHAVNFQRIKSLDQFEQVLQQANKNQQWVMLDFYADWCISCKEMEAYTLSDPGVKRELDQFVLIQADVTKNDQQDKQLLTRFGLIGPPAILFFAPDKLEKKAARVIGFQDKETFLSTISSLQYL